MERVLSLTTSALTAIAGSAQRGASRTWLSDEATCCPYPVNSDGCGREVLK